MTAVLTHHTSYNNNSTKSCSNIKGKYDPTLATPYNSTACEQAVWRAVIVQALMDAASNSKKQENLQSKEEALIWLRGNSADFMTVCSNAGFEPDFVREMAKKALLRGCQWRAAPGSGEKARKERAAGICKNRATQSR